MKNFKLLTLFLFLTLVGLSSCGKDDDGNGEDNTGKVKLTAVFKCTMKDGRTIDAGLTTMCLYDTKGENTGEWKDANNEYHNMVRKDGTYVYPKYTFKANLKGKIDENIDANTPYFYLAICGSEPKSRLTGTFDAKTSITVEKTFILTNQ